MQKLSSAAKNDGTEVNIFLETYSPPSFLTDRGLNHIPLQRLKIGIFPTPLHRWNFKFRDECYSMLIKRDDLNESAANGNKLRKLEFILPEVLTGKHDWILSLGPLHSNSCRVVSVIASRLGLRSAHVLVKDAKFNENQPLQGNVFLHKLFGAELFLITRDEYLEKGQEALLEDARQKLIKSFGAVNPYILPMGGSTLPGVFGYIECIRELESQLEEIEEHVDEIFFACGSGGTAAGLAIGKYLSKSKWLENTSLTGFIAWDSPPEYFHKYVNDVLTAIGLDSEVKSEDLLKFVEAKGMGYGLNTDEELEFIRSVARTSGVILDGTYTGKAVKCFVNSGRHVEKKCVFLQTGGMLSMMGNQMYIEDPIRI